MPLARASLFEVVMFATDAAHTRSLALARARPQLAAKTNALRMSVRPRRMSIASADESPMAAGFASNLASAAHNIVRRGSTVAGIPSASSAPPSHNPLRRGSIVGGMPSGSVVKPLCIDEPPKPEPAPAPTAKPLEGDEDGLEDSAALRAVRTSAALGLRICHVALSDLLIDQIAMEAEMSRVVSAYHVITRSVEALNPQSLQLILQIKEPPELLAHVIEGALVLLEPTLIRQNNEALEPPASRVPAAEAALHPPRWAALDPIAASHALRTLEVDSISAAQLAPLEVHLTSVSYDKVRQAYGIASYLWAWVCAIAVIAGSPVACLPFEDLKEIQAHRAALRRKSSRPEAPLPPRPRSCQGAPITGRPSYKATETASYLPSPSSNPTPQQVPEPSPVTVMRPPLPYGPSWASVTLCNSSLELKAAENVEDVQEAAPNLTATVTGAASSASKAPTQPNDLEPVKFLGSGAFANVFMCRHKETGTVKYVDRPPSDCAAHAHTLPHTIPLTLDSCTLPVPCTPALAGS